ncbi:hypothetical protein M1145_02885, partial [Patescibacteria group bacterium]|nr:hypothetical protein [Patescibacteria group bacterium]
MKKILYTALSLTIIVTVTVIVTYKFNTNHSIKYTVPATESIIPIHSNTSNILSNTNFSHILNSLPDGWVYINQSNKNNTYISSFVHFQNKYNSVEFNGLGTFGIQNTAFKTQYNNNYRFSIYVDTLKPTEIDIGFINKSGDKAYKKYFIQNTKQWIQVSYSYYNTESNTNPFISIQNNLNSIVYLAFPQITNENIVKSFGNISIPTITSPYTITKIINQTTSTVVPQTNTTITSSNNINGNSVISGNTSIGGTLSVTGNSTLNGITNSGSLVNNGTASVNNQSAS